MREVVRLKWNYNEIAADYRAVAARAGLLPNQLQAITWFTWKRINRIVYPGRQLNLFNDNSDLWRTFADADKIETYPYFEKPSPAGAKMKPAAH